MSSTFDIDQQYVSPIGDESAVRRLLSAGYTMVTCYTSSDEPGVYKMSVAEDDVEASAIIAALQVAEPEITADITQIQTSAGGTQDVVVSGPVGATLLLDVPWPVVVSGVEWTIPAEGSVTVTFGPDDRVSLSWMSMTFRTEDGAAVPCVVKYRNIPA